MNKISEYYKILQGNPKRIREIKTDILLDDLKVMGKQGYIKDIYLYLTEYGNFLLLDKPNLTESKGYNFPTWDRDITKVAYVGVLHPEKTKKKNYENAKNLLREVLKDEKKY